MWRMPHIEQIVSGRRAGDSSMSSSVPLSGAATTLHSTAFLHVGSVHCAQRPASYLRSNACILTALFAYSPVCDARTGATCTLVSCHIWQCHV